MPSDQEDPLVPLSCELQAAFTHFLEIHIATFNGRITFPIGAIETVTAAVIGNMQRSTQDDPITVDFLLHRIGRGQKRIELIWAVDAHQGNNFRNAERSEFKGFGKNIVEFMIIRRIDAFQSRFNVGRRKPKLGTGFNRFALFVFNT